MFDKLVMKEWIYLFMVGGVCRLLFVVVVMFLMLIFLGSKGCNWYIVVNFFVSE